MRCVYPGRWLVLAASSLLIAACGSGEEAFLSPEAIMSTLEPTATATAQASSPFPTLTQTAEQALLPTPTLVSRNTTLVQTIAYERELSDLDWSPDGARIVGGTNDGNVIVWDAATGSELLTFQNVSIEYGMYGVAWSGLSENGESFIAAAAAHRDYGIVIWNAETGERIQSIVLDSSMQVFDLEFSPNATMLAVAQLDIDGATIWNVQTGEQLHGFPKEESVTGVAWSPDGERIAFADGGSKVLVWSLADDKLQEFTSEGICPVLVDWSPNGSLLATTSQPPYGTGLAVWDSTSGELLYSLQNVTVGNGLAFSPDAAYLALSEPLTIVQAGTGDLLDKPQLSAYPLSLSWSNNGELAVAVTHWGGSSSILVFVID